MRRLVLLACAIVLVDTMFYAAITPLLPHYADDLHLSKSAAGILSASYAAGTLIASIPAGWFAARAGVKPAVLLGLGLMAVSSVAFGFGHHVVLLDVTRFVQGIGGALSWAGTLAWMIGEAPSRRGELIGTALGAAIFGALLGPVLGAAAVWLGPEAVFSGVAVLGVVLIVWTLRVPAAEPSSEPHPSSLLRALRRGRMGAGLWLTVLPAIEFSMLAVLAPLHMDDLGASSALIGGVFVAAAAISAVLNPFIGRISDRRGRLLPIRACLIGSVVLAGLLPWPQSLALFIVVLLLADPIFGAAYTPAGAILSEEAESAGLDQALAFGLFNMAWGVGQLTGAGAGAALAQATSDRVAYLVLAALALATLVALVRFTGARRATASAAGARGYDPAP
ncbi:MAG: MFS transporter [Thermoleophilaceae bacterium]